jgi:DNA-binding MarR family transcriptional regulator
MTATFGYVVPDRVEIWQGEIVMHRVLAYLERHGPSSQREVAEALGMTRDALSSTIRSLKLHGCVERIETDVPNRVLYGACP